METDVLVVGAGPAGLTAAAELRRLGVARVLVADREAAPGGIPRHSNHLGYGLRDLHRVLSGPSYARALADLAARAGAELRTGCTVTDLRAGDGPPGTGPPGTGPPGAEPPAGGDGWSCVLTSAAGIEEVRATAVLLATGCRERPRAARLVPGDRPSGVLTTGELQQRVYLAGERLDGRALVVGAEHVSFSAALTLAHAGARVLALVTDQPRHASYAAFALGTALRWRLPVWTSSVVTRVTGVDGRLAAVDVAGVAGTAGGDGPSGVGGRLAAPGADGGRTRTVNCEWLVFTGDWIPDHVLARTAGVALDAGTRGPAIDTTMATSAPGVFAAGNLVHAAETADVAALSGRHAARQIAAYLRARPSAPAPAPAPARAPVPVVAEPPLRWISPNAIAVGPAQDPGTAGSGPVGSAPVGSAPVGSAPVGSGTVGSGTVSPPLGRFAIRAAEYWPRARLEARQDGRLLARSRPLRLIPGRPVHLRASWLANVDPAGGPVRVGAERLA